MYVDLLLPEESKWMLLIVKVLSICFDRFMSEVVLVFASGEAKFLPNS